MIFEAIFIFSVIVPVTVSSLDCSACETGTIYDSSGVSQGDPWTSGNCSTFSLVTSDVTTCSQSDEICVYRFELYSLTTGDNITHTKRECTTYAALSSSGVTASDYTVGTCVLGTDAEAPVTPYKSSTLAAAGKSSNSFQSYGSAYFCVFSNSSQFVPTICSDGTLANSCSSEQNNDSGAVDYKLVGMTMFLCLLTAFGKIITDF